MATLPGRQNDDEWWLAACELSKRIEGVHECRVSMIITPLTVREPESFLMSVTLLATRQNLGQAILGDVETCGVTGIYPGGCVANLAALVYRLTVDLDWECAMQLWHQSTLDGLSDKYVELERTGSTKF